MRKFLFLSPLVLIVAAVLAMIPSMTAPTADAQKAVGTDEKFFLKVDGVDGEAVEGDHVGEIMLHSFDWDQTRPWDTSSKVQIEPFHVVIPFDKSIPVLLKKMGSRERIGKVVLTARTGTQDYLKFTLSDVIITGYQMEGTWGVSRPLVGLNLVFTKVDSEYKYRLPNGSLGPTVKGGWVLSQ